MVSMVRPPCDDVVIRGTRAAPCSPAAKPWIPAAILGAGKVFAGGTVVTVMRPTLQAGLGADAGDAQRVVVADALGLAALGLPPEAAAEIRAGRDDLAALAVPARLAAAAAAAVERAVDEAFVAAFRRAMLATTGVVLAGAVAAALLIQGKAPRTAAGEEAAAEATRAPRPPISRGRAVRGAPVPNRHAAVGKRTR